MKFDGIVFNDHEPYICSVETNDIVKIDKEWYFFEITQCVVLKDGYSKLSKEDKEYGFERSVPNLNQKIFIKAGTTICIKTDTTNDQCHYIVIRKDRAIERKECEFQFELP
jgi:hypothetical protein